MHGLPAESFWTSRVNPSPDALAQELFLRQPENHSVVYEKYIVAFLVLTNKTSVFQ